jgi:hypothetical protein
MKIKISGYPHEIAELFRSFRGFEERCGNPHDFGSRSASPASIVEPSLEPSPTPSPAPVPVPTPTPAPAPMPGKLKFAQFIDAWLQGLDHETMIPTLDDKADRMQLLRDLQNCRQAKAVLQFVSQSGGLQHAIVETGKSKELAARLSDFIVPPASIGFPDLADQFEGRKITS